MNRPMILLVFIASACGTETNEFPAQALDRYGPEPDSRSGDLTTAPDLGSLEDTADSRPPDGQPSDTTSSSDLPISDVSDASDYLDTNASRVDQTPEPTDAVPLDSPGSNDGAPFACTEEDTPNPNRGLTEVTLDELCPPGMVLIGGLFCIDSYEAFVEGNSPFASPSEPVGAARSVRGAVPQGYITGVQAQSSCEAAGKRLCSVSEWERACGGAENWTYPYGPTRISGSCNDARAIHPAVEYFGTSDDWIWSRLSHPCINQQPESLATSGSFTECTTPEGVHDMMGNLHEWVDDPTGVFRGGFYADTRINGEGCHYRTSAHNRSHWDYSTGFRCCAEPS